jgi:LysM repeat protein
LDDTRDLTGTNEIVDYEVESGDSFGVIAMKFEVSTRSIYESNGFTSRHVLQPGDMIKIPPVS